MSSGTRTYADIMVYTVYIQREKVTIDFPRRLASLIIKVTHHTLYMCVEQLKPTSEMISHCKNAIASLLD